MTGAAACCYSREARRRLRVLMISDVYFPRVNGVSTSIQTFRTALEARGIDTVLVAPEYPGSGNDNEADICRLPSRPVPLDPEDRLMKWGPLADLDRRLASADFDLVHIQTPFAAHYAGQRFARSRGIPCLTTYHTHFEEYLFHYIRFLPRSLLRAAARTLARHQCNALNAVVVPSAEMADTLRQYDVTAPMHIVPTGLPESQFEKGDRAAFRLQHGITPTQPVILYVGRVAYEKNIDFLLEATARIAPRHPDLMLVIAGEGPAQHELVQQTKRLGITAHVKFVGYLERATTLRDCYAAGDLFVFASQTETQGLVLLEALASGLPVLAIPALGAASIINPQRGAVAAEATPEGFGEQLAALLDAPETLSHMSGEAIRFAREWDADSQATKLAALYHELVTAPMAVDLSHPATVAGDV